MRILPWEADMDPLNVVAQIAAIVGAIPLIVVAPVEMFFVDRPWAQRFLHVDVDNVADAEPWSFCIGVRNLIAGVGVIIGLVILWNGDASVGSVVVVTVAWYMLLSSLGSRLF